MTERPQREPLRSHDSLVEALQRSTGPIRAFSKISSHRCSGDPYWFQCLSLGEQNASYLSVPFSQGPDVSGLCV